MATLDNLIEISLSDKEFNDMIKSLEKIEKILEGKTVNLTPKDRRKYSKVGNKSENWINQVSDYMTQYPQLSPFYINKTGFDADLKARKQLVVLKRQLLSLYEALDDTTMLLGADIYNTALAYYAHMKVVSKQNVAGSTNIIEALSEHFANRSSNKKDTDDKQSII